MYEGYVYVIDYGDGNTFKIGHTTGDPQRRLAQIAHTSVRMPDKHRLRLVMVCWLATDCRTLEKLLHLKLQDDNVGGEWFELDFPDLVELYQTLSLFGDVELNDRWYDIVPTDYKSYIAHYAVTPHYPSFRRTETLSPEVFNVSRVG